MYSFQLLLLLAVCATTSSIPCYQGAGDETAKLDDCPTNSTMCYKKAVYNGDSFTETVGCDLAVYCNNVALTNTCIHELGKTGICCCNAEGFCNRPTKGANQNGILMSAIVLVSSALYSSL